MFQTNFGYEVEGCELPPIIHPDEIETLAPGVSMTDEQAEAVCAGVSAAIRDYCGWHVAPPMKCRAYATAEGSLVKLPSNRVRDVQAVRSDGDDVADFEWLQSGLIRAQGLSQRWQGVEVDYTAGVSPSEVQQIALNMLKGELRRNPGISSENAGGVAVSYSGAGYAMSMGDEAVFNRYRIGGDL